MTHHDRIMASTKAMQSGNRNMTISSPLPLITFMLLGLLTGAGQTALAQGFYGGSEYLLKPPPPPPPAAGEFTRLPPPPPPPPALAETWQRDGYRHHDQPAPWAGPLWGSYLPPRPSRQNGWDEPPFIPWGGYIPTQLPTSPGMAYPPAAPSRSCIDQTCTSP